MSDRQGAEERPTTYVEDASTLRSLCEHLGKTDRFGLDTEFVGERTYVPRLELIQVATAERFALIDCRAVTELEPIFAILSDRSIEKVVHAGQQDVELFSSLSGRPPARVFDTQVAAAMAGYGAQAGYAQLAERVLGVTVEKTETLTDWSRRPLTRAQTAYAIDDVRHLLPLYDHLRKRLTQLGRWDWVKEELRRFETSARNEPVDPARAYLRVRGRGSLRPKGLTVLREIAAWREEMAQERNRPRGSIVRDEALVEIARKAPTTVSALRGLRAVRSRELDRHADEVVRRVTRALDLPKDQWVQPPPQDGDTPPGGVVELLQAVLQDRAEKARIAPSLLATHAELLKLVQAYGTAQAQEVRIMQGWRRKIAGNELASILDGRASVEIDPKKRCIRVRTIGATDGDEA